MTHAPKITRQTFVTLRRFASTIKPTRRGATGLQVPRQLALSACKCGALERISGFEAANTHFAV